MRMRGQLTGPAFAVGIDDVVIVMRIDRLARSTLTLFPIYSRFTEGFETDDLKAAKALIDCFYNSKETRDDVSPSMMAAWMWAAHRCLLRSTHIQGPLGRYVGRHRALAGEPRRAHNGGRLR